VVLSGLVELEGEDERRPFVLGPELVDERE